MAGMARKTRGSRNRVEERSNLDGKVDGGGLAGRRGGERLGVACRTPGRQRVWQRERTGAATSPGTWPACVRAHVHADNARTCRRACGAGNAAAMRRWTDGDDNDDAAKHLSHEVTMSQDLADHHPACYFARVRIDRSNESPMHEIRLARLVRVIPGGRSCRASYCALRLSWNNIFQRISGSCILRGNLASPVLSAYEHFDLKRSLNKFFIYFPRLYPAREGLPGDTRARMRDRRGSRTLSAGIISIKRNRISVRRRSAFPTRTDGGLIRVTNHGIWYLNRELKPYIVCARHGWWSASLRLASLRFASRREARPAQTITYTLRKAMIPRRWLDHRQRAHRYTRVVRFATPSRRVTMRWRCAERSRAYSSISRSVARDRCQAYLDCLETAGLIGACYAYLRYEGSSDASERAEGKTWLASQIFRQILLFVDCFMSVNRISL